MRQIKIIGIQWALAFILAPLTYLSYRLDVPDGVAFFSMVYLASIVVIQSKIEKQKKASIPKE